MTRRPVVWRIDGRDSGGAAELDAEQRAAAAFGVHLCPVRASVPTHLIEAQLRALAEDVPPQVIKIGMIDDAAHIRLLASWIDRLRCQAPVALVLDPVLADPATLQAYRELLPRATLVTANRREARLLVPTTTADTPQAQARALCQLGAAAVCITGGDSDDDAGQALDWLDSEHAAGWMTAPRLATAPKHSAGSSFATGAAAALALGFVAADAVLLAEMWATNAIRHGHATATDASFACDPTLLPTLSWGEQISPLPLLASAAATPLRQLGLYAIVDSTERLQQVLAAGVRSVQLRIKTPAAPDAAWHAALRSAIARSIDACRAAGAELFINDHWQLARDLGASGVHLGQEDLLALGEAGRAELCASGLALGISSHSLWELCRARALSPRYIACGPVWPTLTKDMPWRPQGLHNLAWWRVMAQRPVVAIGGILNPEQVHAAASCGVDGVCIVRALGDDPAATLPALLGAFDSGHKLASAADCPILPQPSLTPGLGAKEIQT
jgi:hydroxymethylpyrimidine kinase/phosphomethylpyrimidine kinase/thiamine-phosphate diphosphorylase